MIGARHPAHNPARHLVADRVNAPRHVLCRLALSAAATDDGGDVAGTHIALGAEVDRDVVHADVADQRVAHAVDQYVAVVAETAANSVAVPDRQRAQPGLAPRDESAAVAGALARRRALDGGHIR